MRKLSSDELLLINRCCDALESALKRWRDHELTEEPRIETYLSQLPESLMGPAVEELLPLEMTYRLADGQTLMVDEFVQRFPAFPRGFFAILLQESDSNQLDGKSKARNGKANEEESRDTANSETMRFDQDQPPARIGQYEIVGKLGGGGMGTVYRAVHKQMQRSVAIKVMRGDLGDQDELVKRFRREVLAAAKLVHPNIVTAYDAGEIDGRPFLVTELVEGVDLRRFVKENGPMSWRVAVQCIKDVGRALEYSHANQVIHRDVKPANLLLDSSGITKVLDLGLARVPMSEGAGNEETDATAQLTRTGAVMGTASYMAPEQARNTRAADARSDVYSLGCVMFFIVTGRPPYKGESVVDTILAHATAPVPKMRAADPVPETLCDLARTMMAKDPADRPQTMTEVVHRLEIIQQQSELAVPVIVTSENTKPDNRTVAKTGARKQLGGRRRQTWFVGAMVLGSCILFGMVFLLTREGGDEDSATIGPKVNRAVVFSGDGYIHVPSIQRGPGEAVTLEMIARLDQVRVSNPVCWLGGNWMTLFHNGNWGVGRYQRGESLFAVSHESTSDLQGRWQHIAGTWDGQQLQLYVDGRHVPQGTIEFQLRETLPGLYVGGVDPDRLPRGQNDRFFHGAIDAVRVSSGVLYQRYDGFEPPRHLEAKRETLVLFQFDEGPGAQRYHDQSGNGHHGFGVNVRSERVR